MVRQLLRRIGYWLRARRAAEELAEEIETHRVLTQARLEATGASEADASRASRLRLGNAALAREDARDVWIWPSLDQLARDVRCGVRGLIKQPGFAATAILTLAVGVGATTASVSVIESELWRPLPFPHADRLVSIYTAPAGSSAWDQPSGPEIAKWRAEASAFDDIAALGASPRRVLRGRGAPELVRTREVSSSFFATLGWTTALGRRFGPADAHGGRVVILSDGCWRKYFDADPAIVGRSIVLDDRRYDVVGVLSAADRLEFTYDPDLYVVLDASARELQDPERRSYSAIGRLTSDETIAGAREQLSALVRQASPSGPPRDVKLEPLAEAFTGYHWRPLYFFLGASLFVLALSCANVANLLLARALHRQREFAIRAALGGGRRTLVRQLLVEGLLLAVPGTLIGWLSAFWVVRALVSWIPQDYLQRGGHIALDLRAAAVAVVLCGITAVVAGLVPAFFTKTDVSAALSHSARMTAGSGLQRRVRRALVIAEVTMAFVLVFAAGLFLNSFVRLRSVPLGFEANDRLVVSISLSGDRYAAPESIMAFTTRLLAGVRAIPGVADASVGTTLPLGSGPGIVFWRAESPRPAGGEIRGLVRAIDPAYFEAFGMQLIAGRGFTDRDASGAPHVAVINRTLAERHFAGENPIGRQLMVAPRRNVSWLGTHRVEVIGVVENSKEIDVHEVAFSSVYLPFAQHPAASMQLVVRTSVPESAAIASVRGALLAVDPDLPVMGVSTMASRVDAALRPNRFNMLLLTAFAGIAVVLAAVGLYGAMSYAIQQRIPELGLRLALGARSVQLLASTLGDSLRLGIAGTLLGLGVCLILSRAIGDALYLVQGRSMGVIFGVTTTDPMTLACAGIAVVGLALGAGIVPARRAMRIDPAVALKRG